MSSQTKQAADFGGPVVASFESRRAKEMATLISNYGGIPLVAPSMREIPLEENPAAFAFAEQLSAKKVDAVIFMTGVGTETLVEVLEARYPQEKIVRAQAGIRVVARGPKPIKVLRELRIPITISVPEPNTWREILQALEQNAPGFELEGSRVVVQEYGVSNPVFLEQLRRRRGAAGSSLPLGPSGGHHPAAKSPGSHCGGSRACGVVHQRRSGGACPASRFRKRPQAKIIGSAW